MIFLLTDRKPLSYDARRWRGGGGCGGWGSARLSEQRSRTQLKRIEGGAYGSQEESIEEQGQEESPREEGRRQEEEVVPASSRFIKQQRLRSL